MKRIFSSILALFSAAMILACTSEKQPIKTLVITGQNNHNWQVSHVVFKQILENSGMFAVDFAISPPKGGEMSSFVLDFTPYDLVVLDYNGEAWPKVTNERFTEFVRNGGGVVVYHAADNSFPDWAEFNQICALGGWEGRNEKSGPWVYWQDGKLVRDTSPGVGGSHGQQHEYIMNGRTASHPIIDGLPTKWKHAKDELYDRMRGPGDIADLLYTAYSDPSTGGSGREEPLLFTVKYGKGRIFHTMIGHAGPTVENNTAMQCTGFQVTLLRGAEWAATGKVTQKVPADFPTETQTSMRENYKAPEQP
ncbi:MAG: ThuA domain-containing protein [Tannerella sp.]|nr:ThuA domain-containing protein [Tannerella sp.]